MQRRGGDERGQVHLDCGGLKRGFANQYNGEIESRTRDDQALVVKRRRVDLVVLISLTGGHMMILMGVLLAVGVRIAMPMLMRQGVQQRNADREQVRDQRQHHEERAAAPLPPHRMNSHGREAIPAHERVSISSGAEALRMLARRPSAQAGTEVSPFERPAPRHARHPTIRVATRPAPSKP
jgi:hypothetical protein